RRALSPGPRLLRPRPRPLALRPEGEQELGREGGLAGVALDGLGVGLEGGDAELGGEAPEGAYGVAVGQRSVEGGGGDGGTAEEAVAGSRWGQGGPLGRGKKKQLPYSTARAA